MSADNQELNINEHLSGEIDELQRRIRAREELSPAAKQELFGENSIADIRRFLSKDVRPLAEREFVVFWQSLTEEEKNEFKKTNLS